MSLVDNVFQILLCIFHSYLRNSCANDVHILAQPYNIMLFLIDYAQLFIFYITIWNVIYPSLSHFAVILPLCDSTMDLARESPIPDPPVSEFLELSGL